MSNIGAAFIGHRERNVEYKGKEMMEYFLSKYFSSDILVS